MAKKFEMRTSGGRGVLVKFGHPRTRGGGGGGRGDQKRANFCGRPSWMTPNKLQAVTTVHFFLASIFGCGMVTLLVCDPRLSTGIGIVVSLSK